MKTLDCALWDIKRLQKIFRDQRISREAQHLLAPNSELLVPLRNVCHILLVVCEEMEVSKSWLSLYAPATNKDIGSLC